MSPLPPKADKRADVSLGGLCVNWNLVGCSTGRSAGRSHRVKSFDRSRAATDAGNLLRKTPGRPPVIATMSAARSLLHRKWKST